MNDNMGIIKNLDPADHFASMTRAFCQDHTLTHATRSMLLDLFSRPSTWEISVAGIMQSMGMGRDQVRASLQQAEEAGYAASHRPRDDAGRLQATAWVICSSKPMLRAFMRQQAEGGSPAQAQQRKSPAPEIQGLGFHGGGNPSSERPATESQGVVQALKTSNWPPVTGNQALYKREKETKETSSLRSESSASAAPLLDLAGQGTTVTKAPPAKPKKGFAGYSADFETFWRAMPHKRTESKREAWAEWLALEESDRLEAAGAVKVYWAQLRREAAAEKCSVDDRLKYCPHVCRWLKRRGWEALLETAAPRPTAEEVETASGSPEAEDGMLVWQIRQWAKRGFQQWGMKTCPAPDAPGTRVKPEHILAAGVTLPERLRGLLAGAVAAVQPSQSDLIGASA